MAEIIHEHNEPEPVHEYGPSDNSNFLIGIILLIVVLILLFVYVLPNAKGRNIFTVPSNLFAPPTNVQINPPNIQIPSIGPQGGGQNTPTPSTQSTPNTPSTPSPTR